MRVEREFRNVISLFEIFVPDRDERRHVLSEYRAVRSVENYVIHSRVGQHLAMFPIYPFVCRNIVIEKWLAPIRLSADLRSSERFPDLRCQEGSFGILFPEFLNGDGIVIRAVSVRSVVARRIRSRPKEVEDPDAFVVRRRDRVFRQNSAEIVGSCIKSVDFGVRSVIFLDDSCVVVVDRATRNNGDCNGENEK